MSVRKSDRNMIAAADDAASNLERVDLRGRSSKLRDEAVDIFNEAKVSLETGVDDRQSEAIEADEAYEAMVEAEGEMSIGFKVAYDALVGTHKVAQVTNPDGSGDHMDELERYLEGVNPSSFKTLKPEQCIEVFRTALDYWDEFVDDTVIGASSRSRAQRALADFERAYQAHRDEAADVTDAVNRLEHIRREAHNLYVAARHVAAAALRLSHVERPLRDYASNLEEALGYRRSSAADDESSDDADQPTPSPQPGE